MKYPPAAAEKSKTKYWLYKQLGMSYQNFNRMVTNQTQSIKLERVDTLCLLLDCTPNALFDFDWNGSAENGPTTSPCVPLEDGESTFQG